MTVYHKLINGNMLNNYELGDITDAEALKQGYKPLKEDKREEGKEYEMSYEETRKYIRRVWKEIPKTEDINTTEPNEGENNERNLETI